MTSNHDFIHETPTQKSIVDINRSTPISNILQLHPDNYFKSTLPSEFFGIGIQTTTIRK